MNAGEKKYLSLFHKYLIEEKYVYYAFKYTQNLNYM